MAHAPGTMRHTRCGPSPDDVLMREVFTRSTWTLAATGLLWFVVPSAEADAGTAFLPHAVCSLWEASLLALHAVTDALIGASYVAISGTLGYLVYRARLAVPFHWVVLAFGLFIVACGLTHFIERWTLWSPRYWLAGNVKALTAATSVATALILPPLVPRALALIEAATLSNERQGRLQTAHAQLESVHARAPAQLIDDLLDVSRIISGKLRLDIQAVDLGTIVEAALEATRPAADARGVHLAGHMATNVGRVPGDAARLQQVVGNRLSNAIKFTPQGGHVSVLLDTVDARAHPGPRHRDRHRAGLPPSRLRPLPAGGGADHADAGGLGLGLAIVKHIVDLHGGTVRAESEGEGRGATVTVELPIRAAAERAGGGEPKPSIPARAVPFQAPPILEGLRILVVVGVDADARDLLTTILGHCRARVTAVGSAPEALAAIEGGGVDLLVSDIGLPGEDGDSLIKRVRALERERGGRLPAVALTAYAGPEDRRLALLAGFQMPVAKPIQPGELVGVVANAATMRSSKAGP